MKTERYMLWVWLGSITWGCFGVVQTFHPIPTDVLLEWGERIILILALYLFGKLVVAYLAHRAHTIPATAERAMPKPAAPRREAFNVNTQRATVGRRSV
ncbi:MAG: hypothetical protein WC683_19940 [bacterium]